MVTATMLKLPVIGDFVKHIREANTPAIVKDSLRVTVAAVAIVALKVIPTLTANIAAIPYIGGALRAFQSLSPLTQKTIVILTSLPAFGLALGVGYIASAVAILAQAHMALSVVSVLDVLSRLFVGAMIIHHYRVVEFGAIELAMDEARRTRIGTRPVEVPKLEVHQEQVSVPTVHVTGTTVASMPTVEHQSSAGPVRAKRGSAPPAPTS